MMSNRLAFGALAVACVTAAAGGGYLATRQATLTTEAATTPAATALAAGTGAGSTESSSGPDAPAPVGALTGDSAAVSPSAKSNVNASGNPTAKAAGQDRRERTAAKATPAVARETARPDRRRDRPSAGRAGTPDPASSADAAVLTQESAATAATPGTTPPALIDNRPTANPAPLESTTVDPVGTIAPAAADVLPTFEELVVQSDAVIGLELDRGVSSDTSRVEQTVEAHVVRDVRVGGRVAIPAGARAIGSVTVVERGGRFKERARLGIAFHTLVMPDNTRVPISTDTIYRYGDAPGDKSAKKIGGGAVAGAILGAIIGGAKGAAVGATAGAGGGTAMVMAGERSAAEFPAGADVTARILSPVTITVER